MHDIDLNIIQLFGRHTRVGSPWLAARQTIVVLLIVCTSDLCLSSVRFQDRTKVAQISLTDNNLLTLYAKPGLLEEPEPQCKESWALL